MAKHALTHHLRRVVAALAGASILVVPGAAHAASAKVDRAGRLTYTAASGETNDLTVTHGSSGAVKLEEAGHLGRYPILIAASGGCTGFWTFAACNGATSSSLSAGDGDDKVAALNGSVERISCGTGIDSVSADPNDAVAADCETVSRSAAPQPAPLPTQGPIAPGAGQTGLTPDPPVDGGGASPGEPGPSVNIEPVVIPRQTAAVGRSGVVSVRVVCPPDAGACAGTVELVLLKGAVRSRARLTAAGSNAKGVKIGGARFTAEAGEKPIVRIRLNRRGRRRVLRRRHTRCRVVVKTRSAGGKVVTSSQTITLRPRRRAGRATKRH
ncbi:MAG: hypothetical protein ACJ8HQ_10255 [Chthoniobacterales bacterium]